MSYRIFGLYGSGGPKEEPEPGEWKTDENGKRYRECGHGVIEYEPTINTTAGTMTLSQHKAWIEAQKQKKEKTPEEIHKELDELANRKTCPFSDTGLLCIENCAFRVDYACALAVIAETLPPLPQKEMTSGKDRCPITRYTCSSDCALCLQGSCSIKKIAKGILDHE